MTSKLRVLIVTATFHPTTGGAETYALEIAKGLASAGHAVAIATDQTPGLNSGLRAIGDPSYVLIRRFGDYRRFLDDETKVPWEQLAFGLLPELNSLIGEFVPDVVLSNSLDTALMGKIVHLQCGIPWVATFHEQAPEVEPLGLGRVRLIYGTLRPQLILAGSEFYAARARSYGIPEDVRLIYHGVNTDLFSPATHAVGIRQRYRIAPDDLVIVCAGRLKPRKGLRELINAFGLIARGVSKAHLLIVGSTNSASRDYADQLRVDVIQLGLEDKVHFDETVPHAMMPAIFAAADVVAQPSLEEGLGLSVLEGMASAKAVITTDIPGIREITTEPGVALIVPPQDTHALAEALHQLLTNSNLRHALGAHGRDHVERHFSLTRCIRDTEAALLDLTTSYFTPHK